MNSFYLGCAIVLEVAGTLCMKVSHGFTHLVPTVAMFVLYGLSLAVLALAIKKIDVGVAYAIWAGVGTALIALAGWALFKEPISAMKIVSLALIIVGVVSLQLSGSVH